MCGTQSGQEVDDLRATSLSTLTQMLSTSRALTLLPELSLPVETRGRRDLAVRPFRRPSPQRTIGLAFRQTSPRREELQLLAESLRAWS